MPRTDLLALEPEDLIVLSNRGLVKRALAEVEAGELTCEITEDAGALRVRWSDDAECTFPAGKPLADAFCTCPATTLCRHLLRSVLAYQRDTIAAPESAGTEPDGEAPVAEPVRGPWDPGAIPDEELERLYRKPDLARARRRFEEGQVLELLRGDRPSVHFHTLSCTLRFLVRDDLHYTRCDCSEPAPCSHVPLAVWGFRLLEPERTGGLLSTRREALPVPEGLLAELEQALLELALDGVSGAPGVLTDRLTRLEGRCRDEGLLWPAEILSELIQLRHAYGSHDARFSPRRVAELVGELWIRMAAIRSDNGAVPPLFVRGAASDAPTELRSSRLVGLGCGARVHRGGVELEAFLQDVDTGTVMVVSRDFPDPEEGSGSSPRDFHQLAQWPAVKGVPYGQLGAGQLLLSSGRRTPAYRLVPGRSPSTMNPQTFQWESLRPPALVESFAELSARLAARPPAALRPRRAASNLWVCPVAAAEQVEFSVVHQSVVALLRDREGGTAVLVHPYTSRGREGAELLLARLRVQGESLRFVAGRVEASGQSLRIAPVSLVFEEGKTRRMLQPWLDRWDPSLGTEPASEPPALSEAVPSDPAAGYFSLLQERAAEDWLIGLRRGEQGALSAWRELRERGAGLGYHRLVEPVGRLVDALDSKRHTLAWDGRRAAAALLSVTALARLADDRGA